MCGGTQCPVRKAAGDDADADPNFCYYWDSNFSQCSISIYRVWCGLEEGSVSGFLEACGLRAQKTSTLFTLMQGRNRLNAKVPEIFRGGTVGDKRATVKIESLHIELIAPTVSSLRHLSVIIPVARTR